MSSPLFDASTARPRAGLGVTAYELDQEMVLYDGSGGQAYVLNATGTRIWQLCDGQRDAAAIAAEIGAVYGLEYERALADVSELIQDLLASGLVVID